jgi:phosphoglycerate kinase
MQARGKDLLLPEDHIVSPGFNKLSELKETSGPGIEKGWMGLDIGPRTIAKFTEALAKAKTIFWNGPMGVFETPELCKGTFAVAQALAENGGTVIVGGSDSASAAQASGYADKMSHISTGGGASLEYLQGIRLPGLEALRPPKRSESVVEDTL